MSADRSIAARILTIFLVFAIPAGLSFRKLPAPELSPAEAELAKFTIPPAAPSPPPQTRVYSNLACPVTPLQIKPDTSGEKTVKTATQPPVTAVKAKPAPQRSLDSLPVVSVISYDGATRTAIVGNRVVTEGSELEGGKIVKIEENRVLLRKTGKNIWLTIE